MNMNALFPIIRRQRRPLVDADFRVVVGVHESLRPPSPLPSPPGEGETSSAVERAEGVVLSAVSETEPAPKTRKRNGTSKQGRARSAEETVPCTARA